MKKRAWGAFSLRTHLIAFGVAILIPVAVLAGVLLIRSAMFERDQLEARLLQVADDLAFDIDREVERSLTILQTLATLPSLDAGDWKTFYEQAKSAVGANAYVILIDSSLRQLVNTYVPYGEAPVLTGDPETARRMIATKKPDVSDLFVSLVTKRPVYNINIPIIRNGEVRYILLLGQLVESLLPILENQRLGPEWVSVILDRKGRVIARSRNHERYVGTSPVSYEPDLETTTRAIRRTSAPGNEPVLRATARCRTSGWLAAVSIPLALAEAPLRRSVLLWGAMAGFALALTLVVGWLFGRALERPMASAAEAAEALGREQLILPLNSTLIEANDIVSATARARSELEQRANAQQVLSNELSHRVKNVLSVVQTLARHTLSDQRSIAEARQLFFDRLQALGRAHDQLFNTDWKGIPIKEIVNAELAPFPDRVHVEGPEVVIDGKKIQTFHLVLHELATNAVKYGALSNVDGKVLVSWAVNGSGSQARFTFRWAEQGGSEIKQTTGKGQGFGKMLLLSAFAAQGVEPQFEFGADGFVYAFDVPLSAIAKVS